MVGCTIIEETNATNAGKLAAAGWPRQVHQQAKKLLAKLQ